MFLLYYFLTNVIFDSTGTGTVDVYALSTVYILYFLVYLVPVGTVPVLS